MQSGRNRVSKQLSSTPWHKLILDFSVDWGTYFDKPTPRPPPTHRPCKGSHPVGLCIRCVLAHISRDMQSEAQAALDPAWAGYAQLCSNSAASSALPHSLVCAVAQAC